MRNFLLWCVYTVWVAIFAKLAFGIPANAALAVLIVGFALSGLKWS